MRIVYVDIEAGPPGLLWIPLHARFNSPQFEAYVKRLEETGRGHFAAELNQRKARHG
jgi:hypothetical protein